MEEWSYTPKPKQAEKKKSKMMMKRKPCPYMHAHATLDSTNPFGHRYRDLEQHFDERSKRIKEKYKDNIEDIYIIYECEFHQALNDPKVPIGQFYQIHDVKQRPPPAMVLRDFLR